MAQVPINPGAPQVQPSAAPTPFEHVQPAPSLGQAIGQGLGALGQASQQTSQELQQHAIQFQTLNNQQASDSAAMAANHTVDNMVRDYLVNNPGMAAYQNLPDFYKKLEETRSNFGKDLPLAAQVEFDTATRRWMGSAFSTVSSQAANMRNQSIDGTARAAAALAVDKAASDPHYDFTADIGKQANTLATLHGWTVDQTMEFMRQHVSQVYLGQAKRAIDNSDYTGAKAVIAAHGSDMTQRDLDTVMGPLRTLNHADQVASRATAFLTGGTWSGAGSDATLDDIAGLERSADGAVSPKGAVSRFQITRDTAATYGLDYDRLHNDPEYAKAGAQKILDHIHQQFPGDGAAQLVAWNGGPGRVPEFKSGGASTLPQETQNYLARSRFGQSEKFSGFGALTPSMDVPTYLGKVETAAFDYAQHNISDAHERDQFIQEVDKQARLSTAGIMQQQQGTYDTLGKLVEDGTIRTVTDLQQKYAGQWNQLPYKYQSALENRLTVRSKWMTPDEEANIETLNYNRFNNPNAFMGADIRSMHLPFPEERKYLDIQGKMHATVVQGKQLDDSIGKALRDPLVTTPLKGIGLSANADPTNYQRFIGALGAEMEAFRDGPGKGSLPHGKDLSAMVSKLIAVKGHTGQWIPGVGGQPQYDFQVPGVPDDQVQAIRGQYLRATGRDATPDQIAQVYAARPQQ